MKKVFRNIFSVGVLTLLGLGVMASANASTFQIAADGSGLVGAVALDTLGVSGKGFVQIDPATGMFQENGAFEITAMDYISPVGANDLTLTYMLQGYIDPYSNQIVILGGGFKLYSDSAFNFGSSAGTYGADDGTLIGSFMVDIGGGDPTAGTVGLDATLVPGSLLAGYLFDASGRDLSALASVTLTADFLNYPFAGDAQTVQSLVCDQAGRTDLGCSGTPYANTDYTFLVANVGVATINSVPEPASTSLALAGLLGMGMMRRRRAK